MRRAAMATVVAAAMALLGSALMAQERPGRPVRPAVEGQPAPQLTPEQQAFVDQEKELRKQILIARLELQLAEAKEAPQREIADKAERFYSLMGTQHAFLAKNREVAEQVRQRARQERQRRRGLGADGQPGLQRGPGRGTGQGGRGGPGFGGERGRRHGMGRGGGAGMGWGLSDQGRGEGRGMGGRRGMGGKGEVGAGRGRGWHGRQWETSPEQAPPGAEVQPDMLPAQPTPEYPPAEEPER